MKLTYLKNISYSFLMACLTISCQKEEVTKPEPMRVEVQVQEISQFNAKDGAISATVTGGEGPYRYYWSNGSTDAEITNLAAGVYTVKIFNDNSSTVSKTVELKNPEPQPLTINFNVNDASYYTAKDGSIQVTVEGGKPPYRYKWETGNKGDTTTSLRRLFAGEYTLTVTDSGSPGKIITTKKVVVGQPEFVCGRDSVIDVDGIRYTTVKVGEQCWTAQNLRTSHKPDAPTVEIDEKYCFSSNCFKAEGANYSWDAAMNGQEAPKEPYEIVQGLCPAGWHLPTRKMWDDMVNYLKVEGNGGTGTNVPNKIKGPASPSGFNALLIGNWGYDLYPGENAVFWTADAYFQKNDKGELVESNEGYYRMINALPIVQEGHSGKSYGLSVRCIKD